MKSVFKNSYNLRFFIREFIGIYRYFKALRLYSYHYHPVYKSDYSKSLVKRRKKESFSSFFMRVEDFRNTNKRISKNVASSLSYFSTAAEFIPFLILNCSLKKSSKVLDYGSGGLRCGFGLLDFLENGSYSCADISYKFFKEAINNYDLLKYLFDSKRGSFFNIGKDKIPNNFYDIVISVYVLCHIPKEEIPNYFKAINSYLKIGGIFYFDFLPAPFYLVQNTTTFAYSYRTIIRNLNNYGFIIQKTKGSSIIAKKIF